MIVVTVYYFCLQRYNKNLRKSLLLAEYFSFWTINPYSEDIVLGIPE